MMQDRCHEAIGATQKSCDVPTQRTDLHDVAGMATGRADAIVI